MERDKKARRVNVESKEIKPLNPDQIRRLAELIPAPHGELSDKEKGLAISYAQNSLHRTRSMIYEGMPVYPGYDLASKSKILNSVDTFGEIESGLKTLNTIYELSSRVKSNKDKKIILDLADDATRKMLGIGKSEEKPPKYDLSLLTDEARKRTEKMLGVDRKSVHLGQYRLRPDLSISDFIYTDLLRFGIVLEEARNHVYKEQILTNEPNQEVTHSLKAKATSRLTVLPEHSTNTASELSYKHRGQK